MITSGWRRNGATNICYTQEAIDPENSELTVARNCDSIKVHETDDPDDFYVICETKNALPQGPIPIDGCYFDDDRIGVSSLTSIEGKAPAIYKDRVSINSDGEIYKSSFFLNPENTGEIKQGFKIGFAKRK